MIDKCMIDNWVHVAVLTGSLEGKLPLLLSCRAHSFFRTIGKLISENSTASSL